MAEWCARHEFLTCGVQIHARGAEHALDPCVVSKKFFLFSRRERVPLIDTFTPPHTSEKCGVCALTSVISFERYVF